MAENTAGLGFLKQFAIGIFIVVIIIFACILAASSLTTTDATQLTTTVNNESGTIVNAGYIVAGASNPDFTGSVAVSLIKNASNQKIIGVGNYTVTAATGRIKNATSTTWANVDIWYTYNTYSGSGNIANSYITGLTGLGSSIPTWISLAAIVVLIGIIVYLVWMVQGMSGGSGPGKL